MADTTGERETEGLTLPLRVADLNARATYRFHLRPNAAARLTLARELDILALKKLGFRGTLTPEGRSDWRLDAVLGATAVQACVISAEAVTTRIDTPVQRRFLRDMPEPTEAEAEIPEDDSLEPLGPVIDPGAVMAEALALALPDYPRAPGASLPEDRQVNAEPEAGPFAALRTLKGEDEAS